MIYSQYLEHLRNKLIQKNLTISVCETFTAGTFMHMLTKGMKNPSEILKYSCVGFSNKFKINTMKVNKNTIRRHGPHSIECAKEIAYNLKQNTNSNISICFIGNPFPINQDDKYNNQFGIIRIQQTIPKTCYAVVVFPDNKSSSFEINFTQYWGFNIADSIREQASEFIAKQILNYL
ncbi:CinA family protein [Mycoplasma sp. HU2014]|uniref:CinA family protein n=1 Tax=Mycoplasma sp. HU2014 TaxID=1664275 RepID=UPI00067C09D0|nr:CinA family protein [Mycoplasma sp. HU2014]KNG79546.1 putative competence-damage inducible protein [Mycoplasma sp. HU2014]